MDGAPLIYALSFVVIVCHHVQIRNFKILNNQVPLTNLNNYTRVNFYLYVMFLVQDVSGTNAPGVAVDTSSKLLPAQLPTTFPGPQAATPANVAPLANAYVRSGCVNWCPM